MASKLYVSDFLTSGTMISAGTMTNPYLYDEDRLLQDAYDVGNVEPSSITPWVPPCISVDAAHLFATDQIFIE